MKVNTSRSQGGWVNYKDLPSHIRALSENELRAMAAQDYPDIWLKQLGGPDYSYSDLIKTAAAREKVAKPPEGVG